MLGLLAACSPTETEIYRPPTLVAPVSSPTIPAPTATSTQPPVETPIATPAPPCTNNLTFLEDLTILDGTLVNPGEVLDKRWQVQNSGTCNWDVSYRLALLSGADLGALPEQSLYPARNGNQAMIRIVFTAPIDPGAYQSAWQAYDPQGNPFGDPIYIQVVVQAAP
jgi:hypothetical protein